MNRKDLLAYARARLGLEIAPWEKEMAGLLALTRTVHPGADIGEERYVRWEYEQNPSGRAYSRIGIRNRHAAGAFTILPQRFLLGGRPVRGGFSVNTMTHPDDRGQGVFPILAESVLSACDEDGIECILGFPNPYSYNGFVKDLAFQKIGDLPLWVLPLDLRELSGSERFKEDPLKRSLLRLLAPCARAWNVIRAGSSSAGTLPVKEIEGLDEKMDQFCRDASSGYSHIVIRDRAYLEWRFLSHPTRKYRLFGVFDQHTMRGFVVTRVDHVLGIKSGLIVDLLVENSRDGVRAARALVEEATSQFQKEKVALAAALMPPNAPAGQALQRRGYWRCPARFLPQAFPVILRWARAEPAPPTLCEMERWYLTMGDYDAV